MKETVEQKDTATASVKSPTEVGSAMNIKGTWTLRAFDENGVLVGEKAWENLVTTEGKNYLLDVGLSGAAAVASWYIGLTDGTPTVDSGDTLASHAGWTEVTAYTEAARPAWSDGGVASASVDNSASPAVFSINADSTTIGGAFLASDNTKGGTTGTLYSVGAFSSGDVTLNNGSTLEVTATFSLT